MPTILDLFKKKEDEVYVDVAGKTFIESRGLINIPRQTALLTNSPTTLGSLIGNEIAGVVKGTANRPSDTIFSDKKTFSKSVSLLPGAVTGVKDAVLSGESYYVKRSSTGPSVIGKIKQGGSSAKSLAGRAAADAMKNPFQAAKKVSALINLLKKGENNDTEYGPGKSEDSKGALRSKDIKFSEYAPIYGLDLPIDTKTTDNSKISVNSNWKQVGVEPRKNTILNVHQVIDNIIRGEYKTESELEKKNDAHAPHVIFQIYKDGRQIILPGTVTGLSENMSPEWNTFKYLGSPFNLYRYGGVERTIQFDLKLYYLDTKSKEVMIRNINDLRKLVFPAQDLAAITYSNTTYSQLAIKPNLVQLTIYGLYTKVLGIIDSLSFTIDESTSWSSIPIDIEKTKSILIYDGSDISSTNTTKPYPNVITVSISMKIIEYPQITKNTDSNSYVYEKDDTSYFTNPTISSTET